MRVPEPRPPRPAVRPEILTREEIPSPGEAAQEAVEFNPRDMLDRLAKVEARLAAVERTLGI